MNITHEFRADTRWTLGVKDFTYDYSRNHRVSFPGKQEIMASAASRFRGNPGLVSPEDFFLAAISSCQMLTYINLCFHNSLKVLAYHDEAVGRLRHNEEGLYWMAEVELRPRVTFQMKKSDETEALAIRLIHEAHHQCFLISSVKSQVVTEPLFVYAG